MKIATYNIENLFHRDKQLIGRPMGKNLSDWISELDRLMRKDLKSVNDQDRMRDLSFLLGFQEVQRNTYAVMRKKGGQLYFRLRDASDEKKATEATKWNGWLEVGTKPINEASTENKARSIANVDPDILILQEVEDRASLLQFNQDLFPKFDCAPFEQTMMFQGNDPRGLELAVLSKNGYGIRSVHSHVNDRDERGEILFDRDCAEYSITTPKGKTIWILPNHFVANPERADAETRRKSQAMRVAEIYERMSLEGKENIVVCGTFNDVSFSDALTPLLRCTDLKDISKHPNFEVDQDYGMEGGYQRLGAYRMGVNLKQRDYLLFSPNLFSEVVRGGLNRRGVWPDRKSQWTIYPNIIDEIHAASSHPVLWAELDI
ncbi:endonuclease/exonuclease/phosphatase family protein [Flavobacteriaceae bacterium F89]|uniref:Endonuclease/exonuclease/phosphatase family protein n=1 Tax=Cerina litoralis TaxID=2874477 RepID=A0AAE3JQN2_9FLAO|nr:endonuclease/exonuclease/phosphatase family protein [Cerina litoralis]MCG2462044.1 endonuclease/exonuclease/phosphatase family protein [Cerina litoralis]